MLIRHRRRSALVASVLAIALVAAACGKSSTKSGEGGGNPTDSGQPVMGGEISYGLEAETGGGYCLTSAQLVISGITVADTIYDTLVVPNQNGDMVPFLAQAVTPNADATAWTIKIRPNIKFHNGEDLTADVVKLNLDEYRRGLLFQFVFPRVADVKVIDPLTVEVDLTEPWTRFPVSLWSTGRMGMMAPEQINSADCKTKLIGTGPFKLAEYVPNTRTVVVKNPNYWLKDKAGNRLPYLDKITFVPQPDAPQRRRALEGKVLTAMHTDSFPQIDALEKNSNIKLYKQPKGRREVRFMLLNVATPSPFANQNARLAVASAINRENINQIVNLGKGELTNGVFDSDLPGSTQETGYPAYDRQKAKDYAAAYKQETGKDLSFRLAVTADPEQQQFSQLAKADAEAAGIQVTLVNVDQTQLVADAVAGNKFDAFWWRNYPGTDPDSDRVWWYSGNLTNFNHIADPQVDQWFVQGAAATDQGTRNQIFTDMNKRFGEQAYSLWAWWSQWDVATQKNVNGITSLALPDASGNAGSDTPYPIFVGWVLLSGTWLSK